MSFRVQKRSEITQSLRTDRHKITDATDTSPGDEALVSFRKSLAESPEKTQKILASATDESVKQKYDWLLNEVALRLPEIE